MLSSKAWTPNILGMSSLPYSLLNKTACCKSFYVKVENLIEIYFDSLQQDFSINWIKASGITRNKIPKGQILETEIFNIIMYFKNITSLGYWHWH